MPSADTSSPCANVWHWLALPAGADQKQYDYRGGPAPKEEDNPMNRREFLISSVAVGALALGSAGAFAQDKLTILGSVPSLSFPFFVHMLNQIKVEAEAQGVNLVESDGQNSAPKQTADIEAAIVQKVNAIVISPLDVNALAPADRAGGAGRRSGGHHRPPRRRRRGHPRPCRRRQRQGRRGRGAGDGRRVPERRQALPPAGPARRRPGDRPQQGRAQRARSAQGQVPDHLRADRQLRPRRGAVGHRGRPCRQRQAGRDHLRQ